MKYWETIVLLNGLLYVILIALHKRMGWLFGIIGCLAQVYVSYVSKIYLDAFLNVVYIGMGIQGYVYWNNHEQKMVAKPLSKKEWMWIAIGGSSSSIIIAFISNGLGNASPYLDSFTTVFSLLATYLTIKKYSENWLFWIVIDAGLSVMFYQQNLIINAVLFLIYTFVATYGWWKWSSQSK